MLACFVCDMSSVCLTCHALLCQLQLVGLQEAAVEFDGLPAVVRLAVRVDQALEEDAEGAGRLEGHVLVCDLQ